MNSRRNSLSIEPHELTLSGPSAIWSKNCCLCYTEEIFVASKSIKEHIKYLKTIFDCLGRHNLNINMAKCAFRVKAIRIKKLKVHSKYPMDNWKQSWWSERAQPTIKQSHMRSFRIIAGKRNDGPSLFQRRLSATEQVCCPYNCEPLAIHWTLETLTRYDQRTTFHYQGGA